MPSSGLLSTAVLVTILTIAEVIYVVSIATWILFEKRSPAATLAWIFGLIALPYVGFVVFFLIGPRRIRRKRLKHKRARGRLTAPRRDPLDLASDPRVEQLAKLAMGTGEPPADLCEDVEIFHDAQTTYDAIEKAIASAKHHVHVAYYIFESGRVGTRFRDALVERAKAGVTVRVLVDDVGSSDFDRAFAKPLREAGIKVARFEPVGLLALRRRIDFRNHRKIVVVDGVTGFTGGINLADTYLPEEDGTGTRRSLRARKRHGHPSPWRDTHVRLAGDAVRWLQLTFLDDWAFATGYVAREPEYFPAATAKGKHPVQVVASGPDREMEPIQKLYFAAIGLARERVLVTTPYFVPDDAILTALTTAALRGVDVRVLVPRRSDSLVVTAAARSYYDGIIAAGVRVYEYQPTMIHAKTIVIDDFVSAVGTANMDIRSFRLNFEITAVLYGEAHARNLAEQFRLDLQESKEIKAHAREKIPLRWRAAEAGARILSPLL